MFLMAARIGEQRKAKYAEVIEHTGGYYEAQEEEEEEEVTFGGLAVVYPWTRASYP
jgi:hypothetical protein